MVESSALDAEVWDIQDDISVLSKTHIAVETS